MKQTTRKNLLLVVPMMLMISAASAFAKPQNLIKYYFLNAGVQTAAQGKIMFVTNPAQSFFTISASHLTPGPYDIVLNGVVVDTLTVKGDGTGKVFYRSIVTGKHSGTPLPYDPRGGDLAIQAAGVEMLGATIPLTAAEAQAKTEISIDLDNLGVGAGTSEASLVSRFGRIQFDVVVHGAAPGTLDLLVGGVKEGEIVVNANGNGKIQFDSRPSSGDDDEGLAELLTFDPRGQQLQLMQAGTEMFQVTFPLL